MPKTPKVHTQRTTAPAPRRPNRPTIPRLTVEVTREVIERSERRNSSHCMIAEALKQSVPAAKRIAVDLQTIRFSDPERRLRYVYLTPRHAQLALVAFDQGIHSDPFSLELRGIQVVKLNAQRADPQKQRPTVPGVPAMPPGRTREVATGGGGASIARVVGGTVPPSSALSNIPFRPVSGRRQSRSLTAPRAPRGAAGERKGPPTGELTNTAYGHQRRAFGLRLLRA